MCVCMYVLMCLEHAHGCLGAWEGGPVVPGPPPLGPWGAPQSPWGASRGVPGGGPGPMSAGQNMASPLGFGMIFHINVDVDV